MQKKILVAYASVSGSTGEVAAAIGAVIEQEPGITAHVSPVRAIADVSLYSAVIVGSSIRAGRWLPEAFTFLKDHEPYLRQVPVAFFTTCLTMVDDTEDSRRTVLNYMEPVRQMVPEITPVGLGLFAGALDPSRLPIMPSTHAAQGDYRNWDAIRAWAKAIRPSIIQGEAPASSGTSDTFGAALEEGALREAVLCYTDMSGADLGQADLFRADLRESNLSGATLHEADLSEATLTKSDLRNIDLQQASLTWAELQSADMRGADLSGANLIGAHLDQADLSGANLTQATLNGANLSRATLNRATLSYADLNWADLRGANLAQADLSYANLGWANLRDADLTGVNLNQARYNNHTQWPSTFSPEAHGGILVRAEPH